MEAMGRRRWAIAEGYIPSESSFSDPTLVSHETACILNPSAQEAHVAITVFFADREPAGPCRVTIGARRTLHLRFNDLKSPQPIPRDTEYASVFESDVPIVVQHTRLAPRRNRSIIYGGLCRSVMRSTRILAAQCGELFALRYVSRKAGPAGEE